jgi:hypothetical protein
MNNGSGNGKRRHRDTDDTEVDLISVLCAVCGSVAPFLGFGG